MFGQKNINMAVIQPTSKLTLKITCLHACGNDLDKAEKLYDFIAKDMELPDFDPQKPTAMEQARDMVGSAISWVRNNRDDIIGVWNFIQSMRGGAPIETPPMNVPPIPKI